MRGVEGEGAVVVREGVRGIEGEGAVVREPSKIRELACRFRYGCNAVGDQI